MAHLYESDGIFSLAQRFHDAVDSVSGQSENYINSPVVDRVDQHVCRGVCHVLASVSGW